MGAGILRPPVFVSRCAWNTWADRNPESASVISGSRAARDDGRAAAAAAAAAAGLALGPAAACSTAGVDRAWAVDARTAATVACRRCAATSRAAAN